MKNDVFITKKSQIQYEIFFRRRENIFAINSFFVQKSLFDEHLINFHTSKQKSKTSLPLKKFDIGFSYIYGKSVWWTCPTSEIDIQYLLMLEPIRSGDAYAAWEDIYINHSL